MIKQQFALGIVGTVGILMSLAAMPAAAGDTVIQIAPRIGSAKFDIASEHTLSQSNAEVDALALGLTLGVVTPIGAMFEIGAFNYSNLTLFGATDRHEIAQESIAVGYQFESKNGFLLVPKAGRMHWRLSDKEGEFMHPGPEAKRIEEGYDYFWELTLEKRVAKWLSLGLDFRGSSLEFGNARSLSFIATFDL